MMAICFVSPVLCTRPHYVYDNADLLTVGEEAVIHDLCYQHDLNSTNEVVVYTMLNLDTYGGDMDLARNKIFNEVALDGVEGIGKSDKDNGVLLVVAQTDSRWGIEVGYGVEGDLTDGECARIGRALKPELQEGNYTAIITAVSSLIGELGGESNSFNIDDMTTFILIIVVIVVIIGVVVFFASKGGGGGYNSGGYSGGYSGGGGGFGGGGSGGGGASGICEPTQSLPKPKRKKILKYKVCPTCNTKRRCELNREYKDETTKGLWIYAILVTAVTCLTCSTQFSTNKTLRQIETVKQRKTRNEKEAIERKRRRKQRAEEDEERRRRRRREDSYRSSSYSSGGFSSGGFGGGGFGGGSSGGGGASG